jgi:hypothetical protein
MTSLTNWNPYEHKVDNGTKEGRFASGAFTMIAAGPPRLAAIGGALGAAALSGGGSPLSQWALPVGAIQSMNMSQNKGFARFWELGSERSYFIAQRTMGQIGLGRIYYHGPSLLRVLYSFYLDLIAPTLVPTFGVDPTIMERVANQHDVKIPPGFENIYLNLASDLFSQPTGLLIYQKDSNENTLGAVYAEECYVPSHSIATDAQGVIVQEQVGLQYERLVPVAIPSVALVTGALDAALA